MQGVRHVVSGMINFFVGYASVKYGGTTQHMQHALEISRLELRKSPWVECTPNDISHSAAETLLCCNGDVASSPTDAHYKRTPELSKPSSLRVGGLWHRISTV